MSVIQVLFHPNGVEVGFRNSLTGVVEEDIVDGYINEDPAFEHQLLNDCLKYKTGQRKR